MSEEPDPLAAVVRRLEAERYGPRPKYVRRPAARLEETYSHPLPIVPATAEQLAAFDLECRVWERLNRG